MAFQKGFFQKLLSVALFGLILMENKAHSQNEIIWGDSLVVRQAAHFISSPRIKTMGDGSVVAIWGESSSPGKIWCSRLENDQFGTPVSVVTTAPGPALFGFGGFDVAVYNQTIFVVFERLGGGIFLSRSDDGGQTFLPPFDVQGTITGGFSTLANIATDESGNVFVNYIQEKSSMATQQVRRSTDGGETFSAGVEASLPAAGTKVCECCIASPVASNGSVWLAFRNNNANLRDHWVSRSMDLGETFDLAIDVDDSDWLINICPISAPRMALSGDSLLVVWKTGAGGGSKVFASSLHGSTMILGQQIRLGHPAQLSDNQNLPDITAEGDTLGIVFQESQRIAFYFSTDGLSGLSAHYTHFEEADQILSYPSVAYRDGVFHLVYVNTNARTIIYRRGTLSAVLDALALDRRPEAIAISPNPARDEILIHLPENSGVSRWQVQSASGKTVLFGGFSGESNLEKILVRQLPPGIYLLHIQNNGGLKLGKFIKN